MSAMTEKDFKGINQELHQKYEVIYNQVENLYATFINKVVF